MPYQLLIDRDVLCESNKKFFVDSGVLRVQESEISLSISNRVDAGPSKQLNALLKRYDDCFAEDLSSLGRCNMTEMEIQVTTDKPILGKRYQLPFAQRTVLSSIVNNLLEYDIIRPSTSPHAASVVLVKKHNGEDRMCVDFGTINAVTVKKPFPMLIFVEQLARLGKTAITPHWI
ncbi:uncharacterized protein LOC118736210 [Rhagoletis pomonella]|uniref:uncharacterized protein LOC118736210 n=1 Tax=Rhagoletis pomonella TaxID=28610 RepID=UPI00177E7E22|nr:uncharacterized protein LOC118736210 [Rhagoletis pomonella]